MDIGFLGTTQMDMMMARYMSASKRTIDVSDGKDFYATIKDAYTVNSSTGRIEKTGSADGVTNRSYVEGMSVEQQLKAKYPNLSYNVGDGSSSNWRTRTDYPFDLLFREGTAKEIEEWEPTGPNPEFPPRRAIAPGSKGVLIHPKAQERMDSDPEFAKEVMDRIEAWWEYDRLRNEAICPGFTATTSQAIAIGEDGEIANVVATGGEDPALSKKANKTSHDGMDWWEARHARHLLYLQMWLRKQGLSVSLGSFAELLGGGSSGSFGMSEGMDSGVLSGMSGLTDMDAMSAYASTGSVDSELNNMLNGDLEKILGPTISGVSTKEVLDNTWNEINNGRKMRNAINLGIALGI